MDHGMGLDFNSNPPLTFLPRAALNLPKSITACSHHGTVFGLGHNLGNQVPRQVTVPFGYRPQTHQSPARLGSGVEWIWDSQDENDNLQLIINAWVLREESPGGYSRDGTEESGRSCAPWLDLNHSLRYGRQKASPPNSSSPVGLIVGLPVRRLLLPV